MPGGTIDDSTSSITGCSDMSTCSNVTKRATISDNTKIDFNVSFNTLNDYYEFTVDLTNDGDIDAMIYDVVKSGITNENSSYLTYTVTYEDGTEVLPKDLLRSGVTDTLKIKLLLSSTPPSELNVNSSIKVNFENADNTSQERRIKVTFDPNGGTVDTTSKMVTVGSTYNELPTPAREGYTFKGWNGKNLLNYDNIYVYRGNKESFKIYLDASDVSENVSNYFIGQLMNNGSYVRTISNLGINNQNLYKIVKSNQFNEIRIKISSTKVDPIFGFSVINLTNDISYVISFDTDSSDITDVKATIFNIQLEEGDTATPYEPYYITNNTTVVQDKNHTLTAIWEEE